MARITYGPNIVDIRNKLGSVVYSRNRRGAYARALVTPKNALTEYRALTRYQHTFSLKAWTLQLTAAQRLAWCALAASYPARDKMGGTHPTTGICLFGQCYRWALLTGTTPLLTPPPNLWVIGPQAIVAAAASASAGTLSITPDIAPPANHVALVAATPCYPAGWSTVQGRALELPLNPPLTYDNFPGGTSPFGYTCNPAGDTADWSEASNILTYTPTAYPCIIYKSGSLTNLSFSLRVRAPAGNYGLPALCARINTSTGACYYFQAFRTPNELLIAKQTGPFPNSNATNLATAPLVTDTAPHVYTFTLSGSTLAGSVDGQLLLTATDTSYTTGGYGILGDQVGATMYNLLITAPYAPLTLSALGSAYTTRTAAMTAGKVIGVTLCYVNTLTCWASPKVQTLITVGA